MNPETKNCQNCKKDFQIASEDFVFYEKIKVPPPTFCAECRNQRRMTWRNERSLYKRKCNAPGHTEEIISLYAPEARVVAYDTKYWWGDSWNPLEYGVDYDFTRPFFEQFSGLIQKVPQLALVNMNAVDSEYVNWADGNKNCYLIFGSGFNENLRYSAKIMESKDSQDLLLVGKSEICYECVNCFDSYKLRYSNNCKSCTDSYFLYSCRNCTSCFGCSNLVNKSYCIFNEQYSKEGYQDRLKELLNNEHSNLEELGKKVYNEVYLKSIHRYANIIASVKCTGDNINNSKNCVQCFDVLRDGEDCKFLYSAMELKDTYDSIGPVKTTLCYETIDNNRDSNNLATVTLYDSHDVKYSLNCHNSSNLFGCIGIRGKQYCIFNKEYSKEEYEKLVPRIIEHMNNMPYVDSKKRTHKYGDFFPAEISPFSYNETIAQEYFPLTKEQAVEKGFRWYDAHAKNYQVTTSPTDLPENISKTDDSVLKDVIGCAHEGKCTHQCTTAYKITPSELQFYKSMNIPLPHLCPNCRHYKRLEQRNPMRTWHRQCQCSGAKSSNNVYQNTAAHSHGTEPCPTEFETSYAPDRPEIVYCEQCYQAEVI